ncbi:hypothetical protein [Streptomyces sp. NPDC002758]
MTSIAHCTDGAKTVPAVDFRTNGHAAFAVQAAEQTAADADRLADDGARDHAEPQLTDAPDEDPGKAARIERHVDRIMGALREPVQAELVQRAKAAIRVAQRARLAGLTTNPHDVADELHQAIEDEQAEHLARPDVGGMPLDKARANEAFNAAHYAMERALSLSSDREQTVLGLRTVLDLLAREAGA